MFCRSPSSFRCAPSERKSLQRRSSGLLLHPSRMSSTDAVSVHHIITDSAHPHHALFYLLPSGKRFSSIRTRTARCYNSFILQPSAHQPPTLNASPSPLSPMTVYLQQCHFMAEMMIVHFSAVQYIKGPAQLFFANKNIS